MLIDIAEVLRNDTGDFADTIELPRIAEENSQVAAVGPIEVAVHATADKGTVQARSRVATSLSYICSRCLKTFSEGFDSEFDTYFSQRNAADDDIHKVSSDKIEFDPFVEEEINLGLNPKPLCREDCRGLCPECGTNLNESECNCDTRTIDPRLEVLKGLLSQDKTE